MDNQSLHTMDCFSRAIRLGKIYLGWKEPIVVEPGNYNLSLTSNTIASLSDTVILKVPLNSTEYYLVENRTRDAYQDGANISYKIGDVVFNKYFEKDTAGFYSFQTDSVDGVVIDVDEFDWALPGSGIIVWHIDENIIVSKIAENKINTDKNLEELMLKKLTVCRILVKLSLQFWRRSNRRRN